MTIIKVVADFTRFHFQFYVDCDIKNMNYFFRFFQSEYINKFDLKDNI